MKLYELKRQQIVPYARKEVFSFFERPDNLARITPASVGFEIITPSPLTMKAGAVIDYTIKVLGIRQHWTTLILDYDPPNRFVDMQLKGPYAYWHHTHKFEDRPEGTLMTDSVRYALPLGPLGRIARALFVSHQLDEIFDYRARVIESVYPGSRLITTDSSELRPAVTG